MQFSVAACNFFPLRSK